MDPSYRKDAPKRSCEHDLVIAQLKAPTSRTRILLARPSRQITSSSTTHHTIIVVRIDSMTSGRKKCPITSDIGTCLPSLAEGKYPAGRTVIGRSKIHVLLVENQPLKTED